MSWLFDTGEQPIQLPVTRATVLDALIYPLVSIRTHPNGGGNGRICSEVNGGNVASTETSTKKVHRQQPLQKSA